MKALTLLVNVGIFGFLGHSDAKIVRFTAVNGGYFSSARIHFVGKC